MFRVRALRVRFFCLQVLDALAAPPAGLSVAFVGSRAIRSLNRSYRGRDSATDVLSFDYADATGVTDALRGEIVICPAAAWDQAGRWRTTPEREVRRLLVHGILHLLGFDHERDRGEMLRLQRRLLRRRFALAGLPLLEKRH
ncbi:MAG: rRNA maturation RNase YbeY [Acidobacteriota bacterium]